MKGAIKYAIYLMERIARALSEMRSTTTFDGMRPIISADGKALFFTSDVSGTLHIYWLDARFVSRFRRGILGRSRH